MEDKLSKKNIEMARIFFILSKKWMLHILRTLDNKEPRRFNEFIKEAEFLRPWSLTQKVLSSRLKELENEHIIIKKQFNVVPPKVEYSLTPSGKELVGYFKSIDEWVLKYKVVQ